MEPTFSHQELLELEASDSLTVRKLAIRVRALAKHTLANALRDLISDLDLDDAGSTESVWNALCHDQETDASRTLLSLSEEAGGWWRTIDVPEPEWLGMEDWLKYFETLDKGEPNVSG